LSRVARALTLSGVLTLQDPRGHEHRLSGLGSAVVLDVPGLGALRDLVRSAPDRDLRSWVLAALGRGLKEADITLYVRLWGRPVARLSPGVPAGLMGRLLGLPGLRVTPGAFLLRRGLPRPT
jgi:hypothetical protein